MRSNLVKVGRYGKKNNKHEIFDFLTFHCYTNIYFKRVNFGNDCLASYSFAFAENFDNITELIGVQKFLIFSVFVSFLLHLRFAFVRIDLIQKFSEKNMPFMFKYAYMQIFFEMSAHSFVVSHENQKLSSSRHPI